MLIKSFILLRLISIALLLKWVLANQIRQVEARAGQMVTKETSLTAKKHACRFYHCTIDYMEIAGDYLSATKIEEYVSIYYFSFDAFDTISLFLSLVKENNVILNLSHNVTSSCWLWLFMILFYLQVHDIFKFITICCIFTNKHKNFCPPPPSPFFPRLLSSQAFEILIKVMTMIIISLSLLLMTFSTLQSWGNVLGFFPHRKLLTPYGIGRNYLWNSSVFYFFFLFFSRNSYLLIIATSKQY